MIFDLGPDIDFGWRPSANGVGIYFIGTGGDPPAKLRYCRRPKSVGRSIALNHHAGGSDAMHFHFPSTAPAEAGATLGK